MLGATTCCKTYGCACCADARAHVRAQSLAADEVTTRGGIPQPCHIVFCVGYAAGRHCRDNRCDCCVSLRLCLGLRCGPWRRSRSLGGLRILGLTRSRPLAQGALGAPSKPSPKDLATLGYVQKLPRQPVSYVQQPPRPRRSEPDPLLPRPLPRVWQSQRRLPLPSRAPPP